MTKEELHELFEYKDGALIRKKYAGGSYPGEVAGWITKCNGRNYWKFMFNRKICYVHRAVFLMHHGFLPKYIDHINGNPLDNRIENLRAATQSQNCANALLSKANTSGYKGVTYDKRLKKWVAQVGKDGKCIRFGMFEDINDAAAAYELGSRKLFGEFSRSEQATNRNQERVLK